MEVGPGANKKFILAKAEIDAQFSNLTIRLCMRNAASLLWPIVFFQVVLIPHSHNDPGWGWTFRQYFDQRTKFILDNVVQYVEQNPR